MPEPRAQRTLVKSPPELWAEVSDTESLARHLGELGEIRITRLEAETTVVWEGDRARGTVELAPSGWGTKVTLTAEADRPPAVVPDPEPEPEALPAPPRQGFWARLLRRRRPEEPAVAEPAPEPEPVEPALADDRLEAVLVGVLDDLGSAHHRPFSRG